MVYYYYTRAWGRFVAHAQEGTGPLRDPRAGNPGPHCILNTGGTDRATALPIDLGAGQRPAQATHICEGLAAPRRDDATSKQLRAGKRPIRSIEGGETPRPGLEILSNSYKGGGAAPADTIPYFCSGATATKSDLSAGQVLRLYYPH